MIQTKNIFLKVIGYIIISFFTILIIVSFGLPEYVQRFNTNQNTYVVINGRSITRFDYIRYVRNIQALAQNPDLAEQYKPYIISQLINMELLSQMSESLGVSIDTKLVRKTVRRNFTDPSGQFQKDLFTNTLKALVLSPAEYYEMTEKDLLRREMQQMASSAAGISRTELEFRKKASLSTFVIKIATLSDEQIKSTYADRLLVTDEEVNKVYDDAQKINSDPVTEKKAKTFLNALAKDKISEPVSEKEKDPAEEKKFIRTRLENQRLSALKQEIAEKISTLAKDGSDFSAGTQIISSAALTTKPFAIGEGIYSNEEVPVQIIGLENAESFLDDLISLPAGTLARGVSTPTGVSMFTVVERSIPEAVEVDHKFVQDQIAGKEEVLLQVVLDPFSEKSNITRMQME